MSEPLPDIFAVALRKAGVESDKAVAVGENPYDVTSAAKTNVTTVACSPANSKAVLEVVGALGAYEDTSAYRSILTSRT